MSKIKGVGGGCFGLFCFFTFLSLRVHQGIHSLGFNSLTYYGENYHLVKGPHGPIHYISACWYFFKFYSLYNHGILFSKGFTKAFLSQIKVGIFFY